MLKTWTVLGVFVILACGQESTTDKRVYYDTCEVPAPKVIETERVVEQEVIKEVEVEKIVEVDKVKRVRLPIEYYSRQCHKHIIKHGGVLYVMDHGLVRLTKKWYKVSNSCKLRYKNNRLEVK